jgi:hypothetical protein
MSMHQTVEADAALRPLSLDEIDHVSGGATLVVTKVILDLWGITLGEGTLDGRKGAFLITPDNQGKFYPYGH